MKSSKQNNYERVISAEIAKYLPYLEQFGYTASILKAELHEVIVKAETRWNPQKGEHLGSWVFIYIRGYLKDLSKKKRIQPKSFDTLIETAAMASKENIATMN